MANQFITEDYDKFSDVTKIRMNNKVKLSSYPYICGSLTLVRDKKGESIFLILDTRNRDWIFLRDGKMVLRINNEENVTLVPNEISTSVNEGVCREVCGYEMNKDVLFKLCQAEKIEYKISGLNGFTTNEDNAEKEHGDLGQYCRRFYNGVYDENAYVESLEVTKSSGCMVAAVVFGASLAALSSGAYYLFSSLLG